VQEAPGDSEIARRKYLVLYDSVPGGTGYLADLFRSKETFIGVLEDALAVLETCECAKDEDKDGCYRCLYAYRNAYEMPHTSRSVAVNLLREIVSHQDDFVEIETVDDISVISVVESELEARFIQRLRDLEHVKTRIEQKTVRGRTGYELSIEDSKFDIEPQVEVGPSDGVSRRCSIDFVFRPHERGRRPIAVFLDGLQYHRNRIPKDLSQRRALLASGGYDVWSFTWQDIIPGSDDDHYRNYLLDGTDQYVGLIRQMGEEKRTGTARARLKEDSFTWFTDVLQREDRIFWTKIACAQALLLASQQAEGGKWLKAAEAHLPSALVDVMRDEASPRDMLLGLMDVAADGAADPVTIWAAVSPETVNALQEDVESAASGLFMALHLDDDLEKASPDDFQKAWNGLLRLYNLFQFLPETYPTAGAPGEIPSYEALIGSSPSSIASEPSELYEDVDPGEAAPEAWEIAMEEALEETRDVLVVLRKRQVSAPTIPYEHVEDGAIVLTVELAWPDAMVGVYLPDQAEQAARLEEDGWLLLSLSDAEQAPDRLVDRIRSTQAQY